MGCGDCPPKPPILPGHVADADRPDWLRDINEANAAACAGKEPGRHELSPPSEKEQKKAKHDGKAGEKDSTDSVITIRRRGELIYPVDIVVTFEDGSRDTSVWTVAEQLAHPEERLKIMRFFRRAAVEKSKSIRK